MRSGPLEEYYNSFMVVTDAGSGASGVPIAVLDPPSNCDGIAMGGRVLGAAVADTRRSSRAHVDLSSLAMM